MISISQFGAKLWTNLAIAGKMLSIFGLHYFLVTACGKGPNEVLIIGNKCLNIVKKLKNTFKTMVIVTILLSLQQWYLYKSY